MTVRDIVDRNKCPPGFTKSAQVCKNCIGLLTCSIISMAITASKASLFSFTSSSTEYVSVSHAFYSNAEMYAAAVAAYQQLYFGIPVCQVLATTADLGVHALELF